MDPGRLIERRNIVFRIRVDFLGMPRLPFRHIIKA